MGDVLGPPELSDGLDLGVELKTLLAVEVGVPLEGAS